MPWCPKCKLEYEDGLTECSGCGSKLVEEPKTDKPAEGYDTEAFLKTAADSFEANIIEAKLKAYGIPVLKKYRQYGDYLKVFLGSTPFEIDLYVPSGLIEKARDLTEVDLSDVMEEDQYMQDIADNDQNENVAAKNGDMPDTEDKQEKKDKQEEQDEQNEQDQLENHALDLQSTRRKRAWFALIFIVPVLIFLLYLISMVFSKLAGK